MPHRVLFAQWVANWGTFLAAPAAYLLSPIFGFSLVNYGPALLVSFTSLVGIALKYVLEEKAKNKTREEDERIRQKVREEWQALVDKPRTDWRTGEYRFAEDLLRTLKERRDALREEGYEQERRDSRRERNYNRREESDE